MPYEEARQEKQRGRTQDVGHLADPRGMYFLHVYLYAHILDTHLTGLHIYIYICTYIHINVCTCVCMEICMYVCMYVCIYIYIYIYINISRHLFGNRVGA